MKLLDAILQAHQPCEPAWRCTHRGIIIKSLNEYCRHRQTGHLKQLQLADIGAQMAGALAHLHSCGIIHADVKPDNFLFQARQIGQRPHLVLCDLGMGCQLHEGEVAYQYKDAR